MTDKLRGADRMNTTDKIMALADEYMRRPLVDSRDGSTTRNALRAEIEALVRDAERYRHLRDGVLVDGEINEDMYVHVDHPSYPNRWALIGDELDEAVDAAIQEKQS